MHFLLLFNFLDRIKICDSWQAQLTAGGRCSVLPGQCREIQPGRFRAKSRGWYQAQSSSHTLFNLLLIRTYLCQDWRPLVWWNTSSVWRAWNSSWLMLEVRTKNQLTARYLTPSQDREERGGIGSESSRVWRQSSSSLLCLNTTRWNQFK